MEGENAKEMKILSLHGFRNSGSFLKQQISKWDPSLFADQFDMEFPDSKFPAGGKSDLEGFFPPPYFEWVQYEAMKKRSPARWGQKLIQPIKTSANGVAINKKKLKLQRWSKPKDQSLSEKAPQFSTNYVIMC